MAMTFSRVGTTLGLPISKQENCWHFFSPIFQIRSVFFSLRAFNGAVRPIQKQVDKQFLGGGGFSNSIQDIRIIGLYKPRCDDGFEGPDDRTAG